MTVKDKKILAIIPARSGSKRIPSKNIKFFLGKPLIAYAIEQATACTIIDRLVVDTDSEEIAFIARKFGAYVPYLRPRKLAQDNSNVIDSFFYLLDRLKREENYVPTHIMILQTTSPLREVDDIKACWTLMCETDATTVLTVCQTHPRFYNLGKNNKLILVNDFENNSTNMQAWRPGYILNGCFVYIVKTPSLLKERSIITKNTKAVICPRWRSVDLDMFEDWALAEFLYKNRKKISNRTEQLNEEK